MGWEEQDFLPRTEILTWLHTCEGLVASVEKNVIACMLVGVAGVMTYEYCYVVRIGLMMRNLIPPLTCMLPNLEGVSLLLRIQQIQTEQDNSMQVLFIYFIF